MYEVIFYKDKNGKEPIKEYLFVLKKQAKTSKHAQIHIEKILIYIKALQDYGIKIGSPTIKHIDNKLWELRPLSNRIFFFYWQNNTFVLLHHFIKKSQKTPKREINKAKQNLKTFLDRVNQS